MSALTEMDVADALRKVVWDMSRQMHSVGVEKAFHLLADELEARALKLDPLPLVFQERVQGWRPGDRTEYGSLKFFGPKRAVFSPREGYNPDPEVYRTWDAKRERA